MPLNKETKTEIYIKYYIFSLNLNNCSGGGGIMPHYEY